MRAFVSCAAVGCARNASRPPAPTTPNVAPRAAPVALAGARQPPATTVEERGWRRITPPRLLGAPATELLVTAPPVWVTAGVGLFRSTDEGTTWSNVSDALRVNASGRREPIVDLVFSASRWFALTESALYVSEDDARTWTELEIPNAPKLESKRPRKWAALTLHASVLHLRSDYNYFTSTDNGRTWRLRPPPWWTHSGSRLIVNGAAQWLFPRRAHSGSSLPYSLDQGKTWRSAFIPLDSDKAEYLTAVGPAWGKLFALSFKPGSPPSSGLFVSHDNGQHFQRVALSGDVPQGTPVELQVLPDALLGRASDALYRIDANGVCKRVFVGQMRAVSVSGNEIIGLTASHVIRSPDAGLTFAKARWYGLGSDRVSELRAKGSSIAVLADGPTAFFSDNDGYSWSPGPELGVFAKVAVSDRSFLVSTGDERQARLLLAARASGPWTQLPNVDPSSSGWVWPIDMDGDRLAVLKNGACYWSTDAGQSFARLVPPNARYSLADNGRVRGDELLVMPTYGGLFRSLAGGPLRDAMPRARPLPPITVRSVLEAEGSRYLLADGHLFAWSTEPELATRIDGSLTLASDEWLQQAAFQRGRLLVLVGNNRARRLLLSTDEGATWRAVPSPPAPPTELAACSTGFLVATEQQGVWLASL